MIAVLVPALNRPERVKPLVQSFEAASDPSSGLLYITSPDDHATRAECDRYGVQHLTTPFPLEGGDYARKINLGIDITTAPWILQASDDIQFSEGWDDELARFIVEHPHARVIGTNDLGNPLVKQGAHSTHSLISREYVEEFGTADEPGKALHEGYWHCWVDNELIETAKMRRVYAADRRCKIEHLHHIWHKGRNDDTYRRGQRRYHEDHLLFLSRRPLWRGVRGAKVVP